MDRRFCLAPLAPIVWTFLLPTPLQAEPAARCPKRARPTEVCWGGDYAEAMKTAQAQGRMMLVYFCDPGRRDTCNRFKAQTLGDPAVREKLREYVCVQLPLDATIRVDGKPVVLQEDAAFREMLGRPGIAILDFAHREAEHYGRVVSTFPITKELWYTPEKLAVILDLPCGTLTQRTLIYAVRTHPDRPASASGHIDVELMREAAGHAQHQASIRRQGHHQWSTRFHRINGRLPKGLTAAEVCAESWPGEHLVEAAVECVRCWRLSEGHWSKVRAAHPVYGYDMRRGSNGIWYATGIFGQG